MRSFGSFDMARLALLLIAALAAPNYRVRAEYARCDCARQQWRLPGEQRVARVALKTRGRCGLAAAPRLRRGQAERQIVITNASGALRCPARCALARSPLQMRGVSLAGYAPGRSRQVTLLAPACADKEALVHIRAQFVVRWVLSGSGPSQAQLTAGTSTQHRVRMEGSTASSCACTVPSP